MFNVRKVFLALIVWVGIAGSPLSITDPVVAQEASADGNTEPSPYDLLSYGNGKLVRLHGEGQYQEALELAEKLYKLARSTLPETDTAYLAALNNLAFFYGIQGQYEKAEPLYLSALELRRKVMGADHPDTLNSLNNLASLYRTQGRYEEAEPLHLSALKLSRKVLGEENPQTLNNLNNLAGLYFSQGLYGKAEPLFQLGLELSRKVLGVKHPDTISSLNNLAALYENQGRYGEAEPLYRSALELSREVLGTEHLLTLTGLNNLASLYFNQGRYGEAEPLFQSVLKLHRKVLGEEHPRTLTSLNNLASLYSSQGRYNEAEPLYRSALGIRRKILGKEHPDTLGSLNNLAGFYENQDRYEEAEPLYRSALELHRKVLGDEHPDTLTSLNNLASVYSSQDRYSEAEPLYLSALELHRKVLGEDHPRTLTILNNLAALYSSQRRYGEAEPLYQRVLELRRSALGEEHPLTLATEISFVILLMRTERAERAAARLEQIGAPMLRWTGAQLATTRQVSTKRQLLERQSNYQDVSIQLAGLHQSPLTARLAADTMLRWKQIAGEEEAFLFRLIRTTEDNRVAALGKTTLELRSDMAEAWHGGEDHDEAARLLVLLEETEARLSVLSAEFREHRTARSAGSRDVEANLPEGSALVEFRLYQPFNYDDGAFESPRWAAVLLRHDEEPLFADLTTMLEPATLNAAMTSGKDGADRDKAAAGLYDQLFGVFDSMLADAETVYIAPDGALNLIPFDRLRLPDGRYWMERQSIRVVHSGRALIDARIPSPNTGFLGIGGVDFDGTADTAAITPTAVRTAELDLLPDQERAIADARSVLADARFTSLPASGPEVERVAGIYRSRRDETAEVWTALKASEARIKALSTPPRVVHFATHGFYLPQIDDRVIERPMLLSGLSLAGANKGKDGTLDADGEDGVLFAIEASGLNLHDTELAVMSACDTAQGVIDYSEGVYGLAKAFRMAGAQNTLMTLWALNDGRAKEFMTEFYYEWLAAPDTDPADALRTIKRRWAASANPAKADPKAWAPYVIIQAGQ